MKTIKCSNCNKELIEIDESSGLKDKIKKCVVSCCFCGDKSFKFDFYEKSKIRGISKIQESEQLFDTAEDIKDVGSSLTLVYKGHEIINITSFVGIENSKDGTWILKTQKC